jgi:CheY-like chemotaxis protein
MRMLLVEDEADVRQFLARAVGHVAPSLAVVQAGDGVEALRHLQQGPFDLILSDHRMPNMTGVELLRAVRAGSAVPFLILTADRSVEVEALAAGANEVLSKPISLAGLRAAIARYLPI